MEEKWAYIKGTHKRYKISSLGRVRIMPREKKAFGKYSYIDQGLIMKPSTNRKGYLYVRIDKKGRVIHRLVAKAFIPNPYNKPQVNHIDGNKKNNCVSNLEWATAKENVHHAIAHGLFYFSKGRGKGNSIIVCVENGRTFNTYREAAEFAGCSVSQVWRSAHNKEKQAGAYHFKV